MRIVGGTLRGLKLAEVGAGDSAAHLRPTSDRVREAVFNLLINGRGGDRVSGRRVLDLFAGTGALSLEALSRGAAEALLVDDGKVAGRLIAENIAKTRLSASARHVRQDATKLGPCPGEAYDLVFLDPPYGAGLGEKALAAALAGGWLAQGATIVWEEEAEVLPPPGIFIEDRRRYGGTTITLCEARP